jgi:RHS repeat-associated protein
VRSVRDPRSLSTTYTVDGLGNTNELKSPDTGTTSMTYDAAGNLKTSTDARGKVTTYSYDALNRVSAIGFTSGTGIAFTYGAPDAPGAAGRLVNMTDESGSTSFGYSAFGELSAKTQTVVAGGRSLSFAVSYGYGSSGSANGKLVSMTYPSGNRVNYDYDAAGRVNRITLNPVARNGIGTDMSTNIGLITDIAYAPLGPVQQWQWGNSTPDNPSGYARTFDLDGRVSSYTLGNRAAGGVVRSVDYDEASRVKAFRHAGQDQPFPSALLDQTFAYDELDRLTGFKSAAANQTFQYDASGNRIGATFGGAGYVNTIDPGSNRLMSTSGPMPDRNNQYDAAGNLVSDGTNTYVYSDRGRMASVTAGGATIALMYNGFGERVYRKSNADRTGVAGIFVYDEQGHLIGEYDTTTGRPAREMVYLGDMPVSVLTQTPTGSAQVVTNVFYIYPDHLGTPRLITRPADNAIVWRWDDNDPFGTMPVVDNPSGLGVFTFNLRMPGQYFDRDTRLFYNYLRDYDPSVGRYIQSDPIGLNGGTNTYGYSVGNPVSYSDPTGEMAGAAVYVGFAVLFIAAAWWASQHPVHMPSGDSRPGGIIPPQDFPGGRSWPPKNEPQQCRIDVPPPKLPPPPKPDCDAAFNVCRSTVAGSGAGILARFLGYASCLTGYAVCKKVIGGDHH